MLILSAFILFCGDGIIASHNLRDDFEVGIRNGDLAAHLFLDRAVTFERVPDGAVIKRVLVGGIDNDAKVLQVFKTVRDLCGKFSGIVRELFRNSSNPL